MTKETAEKLKNAKGTITLDINGLDRSKIEISHLSGGESLFIATKMLVAALAYIANTSEAEAFLALEDFIKDTGAFVAESPEQVDVMAEILKRGGKI